MGNQLSVGSHCSPNNDRQRKDKQQESGLRIGIVKEEEVIGKVDAGYTHANSGSLVSKPYWKESVHSLQSIANQSIKDFARVSQISV